MALSTDAFDLPVNGELVRVEGLEPGLAQPVTSGCCLCARRALRVN